MTTTAMEGLGWEWGTFRLNGSDWSFEHCEVCGARFAEGIGHSSALREGYSTQDRKRWVCARCYVEQRGRFSGKGLPTS